MPVAAPGSPLNDNGTAGGVPANIDVPSDFPALLKKGYFINEQSASSGTGQPPTVWKSYVPDYNDKIYIDRAKKLILALAERYDNDPTDRYVCSITAWAIQSRPVGLWRRFKIRT